MDKCLWKMNSGEFVLGMAAERCSDVARVRILRPDRKTDLDLCEEHFNKFVEVWGLSNLKIKLLSTQSRETKCTDPDCRNCLQDDSRTWWHE